MPLSPLYRNLGLAAGDLLFKVVINGVDYSTRIIELAIHRGGDDINTYTPSTASLTLTGHLPLLTGAHIDIRLTGPLPARLNNIAGVASWKITHRFVGRVAHQYAHDPGGSRHTGATTLHLGTWGSYLPLSPVTWHPPTNALIKAGADQFAAPAYAPDLTIVWQGDSDRFGPEEENIPYTADGWLRLVQDRYYLIRDDRFVGRLTIISRGVMKSWRAGPGVLSRAWCLAPTTWEQPVNAPTEYRLQRRTPTGIATHHTAPGGIPTGQALIKNLDWTSTVSVTDQWRRIHGLRRDALATTGYRIPRLSLRIDRLLRPDAEAYATTHNAYPPLSTAVAALQADIGSIIRLGNDWPPRLPKFYIVAGLTERVTHQGWHLTYQLDPYGLIDGTPYPHPDPYTT